MTNDRRNDEKPVTYTHVIGYWLPERKKYRLDLDGVSRYLRRNGVDFREIELERPLEEQGPFDLIVHKLDALCGPEVGSLQVLANPELTWKNSKVEAMLKNFVIYCEKYDVEILEPMTAKDIFLRDRLAMSHALADICRGLKGVFTPPFVLLPTPNKERNMKLITEAGITFPCVLKPLDSRSHDMAIAFNARDMHRFEFPCVAMSFINHNAVLHKIFIIGDEVDVVLRPSIRNLRPGDSPLERFHSARVSKPNADHRLAGPRLTPSAVARTPTLDPKLVNAIARRCRDRTEQRLLGVDVVIDADTGRYGVIDMNKFPGYDGVERFAEHLSTLLLEMLKERDERRSRRANKDSGMQLPYILENGCQKQ